MVLLPLPPRSLFQRHQQWQAPRLPRELCAVKGTQVREEGGSAGREHVFAVAVVFAAEARASTVSALTVSAVTVSAVTMSAVTLSVVTVLFAA